jgi:polyketide synthase PksN
MTSSNPVVIIGIACRFPKANDCDQYWQNIKAGLDATANHSFDLSRLNTLSGASAQEVVNPKGNFLDDKDLFDNRFFNIPPREARDMDPQQRILLEEAYHCIEEAGLHPAELAGDRSGVFVAHSFSDYAMHMGDPLVKNDRYAVLGNVSCVLANRVSHFFDMQGPSVSLDGGCAGSFLALKYGRDYLLSGKGDFVLVGAVNLNLHPWKNLTLSQAHMMSPRGLCRTFDLDADGYVPGEGVAAILLTHSELAKRLNLHRTLRRGPNQAIA